MRVVVSLVRKCLTLCIIVLNLFPFLSASAETNGNTVDAVLTARVATASEEEAQRPISHARIIVVNFSGDIIGTKLTNSLGEAEIPIRVNKDPRFPMKNMGEVTVIAVADGFNEHIEFSVPINEFNDQTGRVSISLWRIDPSRRNEPQFINGSFHRFTVFKMLDYYAEKCGLKRQEINVDIGKEPPWSPELKRD
jgi:hypothetical protein